jgi:glutaredoxin-related protein
MNINRSLSEKSFFAVTVLGTLFVFAETALHFYGKSICSGAGCKLVGKYTRFGDFSILLTGLGMFGLLALLSYGVLYRNRQNFTRLIDLLLVASLAGEGFFTGYQAFRLHAACVFCLTVFGLLVVLGLLRLAAGRREMLAGFAALATVFILFYLVLPADSSVSLPADKQTVLFYSKTCKHCAELLKELVERKLQVDHVLADEYAGALKSVGVEGIPTLYVNNGKEKLFLTGKQRVLDYLVTRKQAAMGSGANRHQRQSSAGAGQNLLNPSGGGFEIVQPPADDGACRQDKDCK